MTPETDRKALAEQPAQQKQQPARQRHISYVCPQCYWSLEKQPAQQEEPVKLWLWKNFVNGRPEYWAFDNAFPINMNDGGPQTLGEPCGYAWLKPSRQGRFDVSDEEVLRAVQNAKEHPPYEATPLASQSRSDVKPWVGLTDEEIDVGLLRSDFAFMTAFAWRQGVEWAEAKLREKNNG